MTKVKTTDLMIGDYFYIVEPEDGHREEIKVNQVDFDSVSVSFLEPIPLTDEFLGNNFPVFEEGYEIGWWPNEDGSYHIEWLSDGCEVVMKNMHFVHEVQHLLRFVGSTKEVVL